MKWMCVTKEGVYVCATKEGVYVCVQPKKVRTCVLTKKGVYVCNHRRGVCMFDLGPLVGAVCAGSKRLCNKEGPKQPTCGESATTKSQ